MNFTEDKEELELGDNIDDEIIESEEDLLDIEIEQKNYKNKVNITLPVLTKYEKSVIIGERVKQLNNNYKTNIPEIVKDLGLIKSFDIAIEEYKNRKLPPFIIKRELGGGKYEEWKLEDFLYLP